MRELSRLIFEDRDDWLGLKVLDYAVKNPTNALTAGYILISGLGLIYDFVLYSQFGINVLDFSEAADFFLAAFKRPEAFINSIGILATIGIYRVIARKTRGLKNRSFRYLLYFFFWIGFLRREILIPIGMIFFLFIYGLFAKLEANRLMGDHEGTDIVDITTRYGNPSEYNLIPIGTTEKFIFGMDVIKEKDKETEDQFGSYYTSSTVIAIPFTNITNIKYLSSDFIKKQTASEAKEGEDT